MPFQRSLEAAPVFPAECVESSLDLVCEDVRARRRFALGSLGRALASWRWETISLATIRQLSERVFHRGQRAGGSHSSILSHLDEAQMLAFLDGELSRPARQQVTVHLQSCWICRGRLRKLQASITAFLAKREGQIPDVSSASAQRVCELRQLLTQTAEKSPADMAS